MQNNFPKIYLFLSIIFFVFSFFVFSFLYKMTNDGNGKAQLAENEWQTEAMRRDEIRTLEHSVKIIEGERAQLETHFAQSSDVVPFLDTIEKLSSKAGTKAEVTSVDIAKDNTGLLVGMKASGSFAGVYKFLTLLENSPYELEFDGVDMHQQTILGDGKKVATVRTWNVIFKIKLLSFVQ